MGMEEVEVDIFREGVFLLLIRVDGISRVCLGWMIDR